MSKTKKRLIGILTAVLCVFGTAVFANSAENQVVFEARMFEDMEGGEYYYEAVDFAVKKGIMAGMGDNRFSPDTQVNHAQLISMLWNLSGKPQGEFIEELSGVWYQGAASWGKESGVYPYELSKLTTPLTRGEIGEMLYLYAAFCEADLSETADLTQFTDGEKLNETQAQAMSWLVAKSVVGGYPDGSLGVDRFATRAECAALLHRFCQTVLEKELKDVPTTVSFGPLTATVMDNELGNFWVKAANVTASCDIERVLTVTWCAQDQSDMHFQELELREDGSYGGLVQAADHGFHFGTYTVDIYAQLTNGMQLPLGRTSVLLEGDEAHARVQTQVNRVYKEVGWDLYACYNWVAKNVSYKTLPIPLEPPAGYDAAQWYALQAFENRAGNCYCYAAAFYQLAKGLGYDAHFIDGEVGLRRGGFGPHGWVIINKDGGSYICDPESQHSIGTYNFYMQPVSSPILRYRWG